MPELCQDLIKNWKFIENFLRDTAAPQEMHGIRDRPHSLEWTIVNDDFFLVKLEVFQRLIRDCMYHLCSFSIVGRYSFSISCVSDTTSFERSLGKRKDSNFFTFGQSCKLLHKLASRCAHPTSYPACDDWFGLLTFNVDKIVLLPPSDFLKKLKLRADLDQACRAKAEKDLTQKPGSSVVAIFAEKVKGEFATNVRTCILRLLRLVREHVSLSSDIVQGMASFDPTVLFCLPQEQITRFFGELHTSFRLRKWLPEDSLSIYQDEYLAFVDHLRVAYSSSKKSPEAILNMVEFLTPLTALRSRPHLLRLFELSCLCLTEAGSPLPVVKFSDVDTSDYRCHLIDLIQPVQSFSF